MPNCSIEQRIEDCESAMGCSNFKSTAWEHDFISSLRDQYDAGRPLTEKQEEVLSRIWGRI